MADLRALEALCPWERADFRAGLRALSESTGEAARRFAADMQVLAGLLGQVPRCPFDDRGASPWTSFRREVAVARRLSDRGAALEIDCARMLTAVLPRMMALLQAGAVTVQRARVFVTETSRFDDDLAALIDAELAERAAGLPPWRIEQEVRRVALRLDADAVALQAAAGNAGRSVTVQPCPDDQAVAVLTGPAVSITRWYAGIDRRARGLKAAGDPRTLEQLRFDVATGATPCQVHPPAAPTAETATPVPPAPTTEAPEAVAPEAATPEAATPEAATPEAAPPEAEAGLRPSFVEPAPVDCRFSRPVQASILIGVETALGLSNDPAWLDGYGWISAPTARLLLVDAELRQVCVQARTGQLVEIADRDVRPAPTPTGVRESLLDMVCDPILLAPDSPACRTEQQHDPTPPLRQLVQLRDRFCDGPTGTRTSATRAQLDHDRPWPQGPTAAWNLVARAARTHQLKHHGWTQLRTPTSTLWFSPAGQVVEVPHHRQPPSGIDHDPSTPVALPDAEQLAALEHDQQQPRSPDDHRPWLPPAERDTTTWTWLDNDDPLPF